MAQISRPFQIAFVGILLLAGVWLLAIHGRSSGGTEATSTTGTHAAGTHAAAPPTAASEEKAAAAPTPVYHGAAPGVEGLTKAIARAHGAVATSQQNAKKLEQSSAQASGESAAATPAPQAVSPATQSSAAKSAAAASAPASTAVKADRSTRAPAVPANERAVEAELKGGGVAVILFWNPAGADDRQVRQQLRLLADAHHAAAHVKVFVATANQVASFGSITTGIQVYLTPTVLVVGKSRQAKVLTGLTDTYSIEQAIEEARSR